MAEKPIIAVCGKGGVGKTALSALLSRAFLAEGARPLLLIDADPAGGLLSAIGETADQTLAGAREELIRAARSGDKKEKERLAQSLDYLVMSALMEREGYSFLSMGRMEEKGCFCPANTLLREAVDLLAEPFRVVLIDAEAGLEQINRQVTRNVTKVVAVSDGSKRSRDTLSLIESMVGLDRVAVVVNRMPGVEDADLPEGIEVLGAVPEDEDLKLFDRKGKPLWSLPDDNAALLAVREIAKKLMHGA